MTHDFHMLEVTTTDLVNNVVRYMCTECKKLFDSRRAAQMHKNMMKRWHSNETNSTTTNETETSGTTGNVGSQ